VTSEGSTIARSACRFPDMNANAKARCSRYGETAAVFRSFIASCKWCGVELFAWLLDVLTRVPAHRFTRLSELLPHNRTHLLAGISLHDPKCVQSGEFQSDRGL
jgi:hypothetical protein